MTTVPITTALAYLRAALISRQTHDERTRTLAAIDTLTAALSDAELRRALNRRTT